MKWFNIIYSLNGQSFGSKQDLESAIELAEKLESATDDRSDIIENFLAERNMLKEGYIRRMEDYISNYTPDEDSAISAAYDELPELSVDEDDYGRIGSILNAIIVTRGKYLRRHEAEIDNFESLPEDTVKKFIETYETLRTRTEKDLQGFVTFTYENDLHYVRYSEITGMEDSGYDCVNIVKPIIEALDEPELFEDDAKCEFYTKLVSDFENDEAFLSECGDDIKTYISFHPGTEEFNKDELSENLKTVRMNYPDATTALCSLFERFLDSKQAFIDKKAGNATETAKLFDGAGIKNYDIKDAIRCYNAYNGYGKVNTQIINSDDDSDKVANEIEYALAFMLSSCIASIKKVVGYIEEFDAIIEQDIDNTGVRFQLTWAVPRWRSFVESFSQYKYIAQDMEKEIIDKCKKQLKFPGNEEYSLDVRGGKIPVLSDDCNKVMNLIRVIDFTPNRRFDSIRKLLHPKLQKTASIEQKAACAMIAVKFIRDFLALPFKKKIDISAGSKMSMTYDAACNLVYYKDKNINASFDYETMFFGSYAVYESEDSQGYFDKLADFIHNKFGDKDINLPDYVANTAQLEDEQTDGSEDKKNDNNVDSSANSSSSDEKSVETMINTIDDFRNKVDSLQGQQ